MATEIPPVEQTPLSAAPVKTRRKTGGNLINFSKYFLTRVIVLFITLVAAIYLSILIANMGGHVDKIREAQIKEGIGMASLGNPEILRLPAEMRKQYEEDLFQLEAERLGLNDPFMVRTFRYLRQAITLNLGQAEKIMSDSGSRFVKQVLLERLPFTLLLTMSSFLVGFFINLFGGLYLSRHYGSFFDKLVLTLAPASAAPAWFYGIFLILVFAALLGWFPFGGVVSAPPPTSKIQYGLSVLHHLSLPLLASLLSSTFLGIFSNRTFFLIYSSEDYVEMAKAKGLSARAIEKHYILRPTLPPIVTGFALAIITQWVGATILETVFNWPGLGRLLRDAVGVYDTPIIIGQSVIHGYLLAATVLVLDVIYAVLDPRVRVGAGEGR